MLEYRKRLHEIVDAYSARFGLSTAQRQIVRLAVEDLSLDEIAGALAISRNTLKTHIRRILQKCDELHIRDIARDVRRSAFEESP